MNFKSNIPKQICFEIIQCTILWYEGRNPTHEGFSPDCSRIGMNLSDALFKRVETLIEQYKKEGKLTGGPKSDLKWVGVK